MNNEGRESRDEKIVSFVVSEAKSLSEWVLKLLAWAILLGALLKQTNGIIVWESAGGVAVAAFIAYVVLSAGSRMAKYTKMLECWDILYLRRFARKIMKLRPFRKYASSRPLFWEEAIVMVMMLVPVGALAIPVLAWAIQFGGKVFVNVLVAVITASGSSCFDGFP